MVEANQAQPVAAASAAQNSAAAPMGQGQEILVRLRGKFTPDETMLSTELRRRLWEGQIALKIDLALDD